MAHISLEIPNAVFAAEGELSNLQFSPIQYTSKEISHDLKNMTLQSFGKFIFLLSAILFCSAIANSQTILFDTYSERAKQAFENNDFAGAQKLFEIALGEAEKLKNEELIAEACVNLGKVHQAQGQLELAEKLYQRSISIYSRIETNEGELSAFALNNLGLLYTDQKKYEKAEETLRHTINLREKLLGDNAPDVGVTLLNLGKLYADQSKFVEADAVYLRSLQILIQNPEMVYEILACLHNLGRTTIALNNPKRAEATFKMSIAIIEKKFGKNSLRLIDPLENYSTFLKTQKRYTESKTIDTRLRFLKNVK
jgi:tetratricopeptide (TPR) repeat protein